MGALNSTANKILDIAETYTQVLGLNGFSYKDIQRELGIKTSSIHYHFPSKQDLVLRLIQRFTENISLMLQELKQQDIKTIAKLHVLADVFINHAKKKKFCLCGMLVSDISSLSEEATEEVRQFFVILEQWISDVVSSGMLKGEIKQSLEPAKVAALYISALEGGLLMSRLQQSPTQYLDSIIEQILAGLLD